MIGSPDHLTPGQHDIKNQPGLYEAYFFAVTHLFGQYYGGHDTPGWKPMKFYSPNESGVRVDILRRQSNYVDGAKEFQDEIECADELLPDNLKNKRCQLNFETNGEVTELVKSPVGDLKPYMKAALGEIVRLSKTQGATVYIDNRKVFVSDGEAWISPNPQSSKKPSISEPKPKLSDEI